MNQPRPHPRSQTSVSSPQLLRAILKEVRLLRKELLMALPQDDLANYAHPNRIKRDLQKALKKYPPRMV